jgi:ABC-2 type transport system permease protein
MNRVWTIAKREFRSYFDSPVAYIAITVLLVLTGFMFFRGATAGTTYFEDNEATLRPLFEGMPLVLALFLPAITMRLFSEEKRSGTMELLLTLPVTDTQVVLGKYLSSVMFLGVALLLTLSYPITVGAIGNLDVGPAIGGYFGLLLIGATYLAIGVMTSVWTRNQIVAFLLAAAISCLFYFVDALVGLAWEPVRPLFSAISFRFHFQNIAKGVLDTRDLFFFAAIIALALLLTRNALESRKWKA